MRLTYVNLSENVGWIRIQEKTFKRWMNEHLKHRKLEVEDITEDLNDGLALINLLEVLSHKSIGRFVFYLSCICLFYFVVFSFHFVIQL